MKLLRSLVAATIVASSLMTGAVAAGAAGTPPAGNGLGLLTAQTDIQLSDFSCDDASVTDVLVPRGGNVGWVLDGSGRMYVLAAVSGQGTVTSSSGVVDDSFIQTYGKKTGKASSPLTCTVHYVWEGGGMVGEGDMTFTLVQTW